MDKSSYWLLSFYSCYAGQGFSSGLSTSKVLKDNFCHIFSTIFKKFQFHSPLYSNPWFVPEYGNALYIENRYKYGQNWYQLLSTDNLHDSSVIDHFWKFISRKLLGFEKWFTTYFLPHGQRKKMSALLFPFSTLLVNIFHAEHLVSFLSTTL